MGYYPDKSQIPEGFEEWTFSYMPKNGEVVDVLRYGKVETIRFDKPYMAFNPPCNYSRGGGWSLEAMYQEGITHFKRINVRKMEKNKRGVFRTPPKRLNESKTLSNKHNLSKFICPIDCFVGYLYFIHKLFKFKLMRLKLYIELHKSLNKKTALIAEEYRCSGDCSPCLEFDTHLNWQRPTLPLLCSTIGASRLNFSVRNGKRWVPCAMITMINLLTIYVISFVIPQLRGAIRQPIGSQEMILT